MKRLQLVDDGYASSSSDEDKEDVVVPAMKRRKLLPALSTSISSPSLPSDPAAHQGRIRSQPHVEGQWAAHVYLPITLRGRRSLKNSVPYTKLGTLLQRAVRAARELVPELHSFIPLSLNSDAESSPENQHDGLHVSISRPIFLRAHQREDLRKAVQRTASSSATFAASFACFTTFTNDEKTRTFLAVEIGAGHDECKALADSLSPTLTSLRQQPYYSSPRFHASIAWALLSNSTSANTPTYKQTFLPSPQDTAARSSNPGPGPFPSIQAFPEKLIEHLEKAYGTELRAIGRFEVDQMSVKIGKDGSAWPLRG